MYGMYANLTRIFHRVHLDDQFEENRHSMQLFLSELKVKSSRIVHYITFLVVMPEEIVTSLNGECYSSCLPPNKYLDQPRL